MFGGGVFFSLILLTAQGTELSHQAFFLYTQAKGGMGIRVGDLRAAWEFAKERYAHDIESLPSEDGHCRPVEACVQDLLQRLYRVCAQYSEKHKKHLKEVLPGHIK